MIVIRRIYLVGGGGKLPYSFLRQSAPFLQGGVAWSKA